MEQRSFIDEIKYQFRHGGMSIRLLMVNTAVFVTIHLGLVIGRLAGSEASVSTYLAKAFGLATPIGDFLYQPWGLITSMFAHFSFWHFAFNMLFLYMVGRVFEQLFDQKRLLYTYLLGGVFGGLFELIANNLFPGLIGAGGLVLGASGAIMAIFFAVAFHRPKMNLMLFGILPIRIIILAAIFFLSDFLKLGTADGTAHFAHLGGAILGMISVQHVHSSGNIVNAVQSFGDSLVRFFAQGSKNKRMKVVTKNNARKQNDAEYNEQKKKRQAETDRILDKISKSGYDSLTRQEKDFLFNQSKNG